MTMRIAMTFCVAPSVNRVSSFAPLTPASKVATSGPVRSVQRLGSGAGTPLHWTWLPNDASGVDSGHFREGELETASNGPHQASAAGAVHTIRVVGTN